MAAVRRRSGMLRLASEDPERGIVLDSNRRDPRQRGNLPGDVQRRIAIARLLGQEENDVVRSLADARSAIGPRRGKEIAELCAHNVMALIDKAILQRLC